MATRAGQALLFGLNRMVRAGVRGVWVRGQVPAGPVVWAANHHSWWDGFVAASVLRGIGRVPACIMDAANLESFAFMRRAGVIATSEPRAALTALRRDDVLIVFPERDLRANGPLGSLQPGAEWLAERAPAALLAVAVRVVMRGHQRPEVYVDLVRVEGKPLADELAATLAGLDAELSQADPREPVAGFELVVPGRRSWDERIARLAARFTR